MNQDIEDDSDNIIKLQDVESAHDQNTESDYSLTDSNSYKPYPYIRKKVTSFNSVTKVFLKDSEQEEEIKSNYKEIVEKSPKGRFQRFNEELGSGAQKKVYMCFDYDNGRECAWNAINVSLLDDKGISKLREEIDIMKQLNHPNIISFIAGFYLEEKKELIIITEIFNGGSLKNHITKFGIPRLRVIKQWCIEILKGLKYLHELPNPIIHRDIKCDNIFINKDTGKVKIGDLGLSCVLKSSSFAKTFSGTIEFCAPEVFFGKYGVKADIYSFGMTMLEMIANERPYKECEGNLLAICDKTTKEILPECLNEIANPRLKEFISSCLKNENKRPSANELLKSDFLTDLESDENNYPALDYPKKRKEKDHFSMLKNSLALSPSKKKKHITQNIKSMGCHISNSPKPVKYPSLASLSPQTFLFNKSKPNERLTIEVCDDKTNKSVKEIKILLKYKKRNDDKKFNIIFVFNLENDTIEGVSNEMKKELQFTSSETDEIKMKLKKIVDDYINKKAQQIKKYYNSFSTLYQNLVKETNDLLKQAKEITKINDKDFSNLNEKIEHLTEFVEINGQ